MTWRITHDVSNYTFITADVSHYTALHPICHLVASRTTRSGYLQGGTLSFLPGTVRASLKRSSSSPAHRWILRNPLMSAGQVCRGPRVRALSASGLPMFGGNFATFGFRSPLEKIKERSRDCQARLNSCGNRKSYRTNVVRLTYLLCGSSTRNSEIGFSFESCSWKRREIFGFQSPGRTQTRGRVVSGDTDGAKRSTKKYACEFPGCHVAFSRLSNRKAHYRIHTGEQPYSCVKCG